MLSLLPLSGLVVAFVVACCVVVVMSCCLFWRNFEAGGSFRHARMNRAVEAVSFVHTRLRVSFVHHSVARKVSPSEFTSRTVFPY